MEDRYFLNIVPPNIAKLFTRFFRHQALLITKIFPSIEQDIRKFEQRVSPVQYLSQSLVSYHLLSFVLALGLIRLFQIQEYEVIRALMLAGIAYVVFLTVLIYLSVNHPKNIGKIKAREIDKYLLFALRDLALQISSGETVYRSIQNVSQGGYGRASHEFSQLIQKLNVGQPMEKVLQEHLEKTDSEYLKKIYWQMITGLKSGSDLQRGLNSVLDELNDAQKTQIQNYARELSLWSLVYMMFSVAIPTIGITMLVILSTFAGFGFTEGCFVLFIIVSMVIQFILIAFVKSRRPAVHF
ncbi:MAG: type II secretion system F family protein [Candidatus Woesearchaeota archaeon]